MTYGPIKTATKSLEALSAEHLETRALCASVTAKIALVELFSLISELAPDEQRELRLSMKAGLKKASGGRGEDAREHSEVQAGHRRGSREARCGGR